MQTGQASIGGNAFTWPVQDKTMLVAGQNIPIELVGIASVYGLAGLWLLWVIRDLFTVLPDVLSGLFDNNSFAFAISYVFLFLTGVLLYIVVALFGVAYLLLRIDPVGRGLSVVVFATLVAVLTTADAPGNSLLVLIVLVAGACYGVLFVSPWCRRAFTESPRRADRPTSIILSQTLLVTFFSLMALVVVMILPGLRFVGDLGARFVFFEILSGASCALVWRGYQGLQRGADQHARRLATVGAGLVILAFIVGGSDGGSGLPIVLAIVGGAIAPLWLAPQAREWFGDQPMNPASN